MPRRSSLSKVKHWPTVLEYAQRIRDGRKIACEELRQAVERFFRDLENPAYDLDPRDPEFCIGIIEKTICHQQGERLDGTPLRGQPFLLEPFHQFIIYNLVGFKLAGTNVLRYHEALIYIPRKNIKTSFAAALAWSLSLLYRRSGSKMYIASAALMQSMESFNFLLYNIRRMGEDSRDGGSVRIIDNHNEHSLSADLDGDGQVRLLYHNESDGLYYACATDVVWTGHMDALVSGYGGNGFTFANYNAYDMLYVIREAINCYHNKEFWPELVKRVMNVDFSWQRSAKEYEKVYGEMLK